MGFFVVCFYNVQMSVDFHLKDYQKFLFVTEVLLLVLPQRVYKEFIKLAPWTACTMKNETLVVKEKAVTIKLAMSSKGIFRPS